MHQELIDELLAFARRNNLRFDPSFDETLNCYKFVFKDQDRRCGYCQEITQDGLDLFKGNTAIFAYKMIETMKKTMPWLI